jgi:hypothetical protein
LVVVSTGSRVLAGVGVGVGVGQAALEKRCIHHLRLVLGIGGEKCDECAVGFVQEAPLTPSHPVLERQIPYTDLPRCIECGECFTNWNRILQELKNATALKVNALNTEGPF